MARKDLNGAAALLGSDAKVAVLRVLADTGDITVPEIARRTGLSKSHVRKVLDSLERGHLVDVSVRGNATQVHVRPESQPLIESLVSWDNVNHLIHPVPEREATVDELDHIEQYVAARQGVVIADTDFDEGELTRPISQLDWDREGVEQPPEAIFARAKIAKAGYPMDLWAGPSGEIRQGDVYWGISRTRSSRTTTSRTALALPRPRRGKSRTSATTSTMRSRASRR